MSEQHKLPLDCMWIITVEEGWKIQVTFPSFKLEKPNECETNFVQIYVSYTHMPSQMNNFCGSIADLVLTKPSRAYLRFYDSAILFQDQKPIPQSQFGNGIVADRTIINWSSTDYEFVTHAFNTVSNDVSIKN